jgi:triacylglycerol lipase
MSKTILLVHGLAESSVAMGFLATSLRLQGYRTVSIDYPSTRHTIEECTTLYLKPAIEALAFEESLSIVTHSMGGVMLRYYLAHHRVDNLERIVMLAPGHGGSKTMKVFRRHPLFPVLMGPAGVQSGDDARRLDPALGAYTGPDLGVVAGCISFDPIAWAVMPWPHDGKLTVSATLLEGMKDHIVLPVSHDTILFDPLAIFQTSHFLKHGTFKPTIAEQQKQAA